MNECLWETEHCLMFWKSATMIQRMISMIKMSFSPINWQKKERKKEKSDSNQHFPLSYVKTLLARLLWTADGCTWVRLVSTCSELKVLLNIWFQRELILKLLSSAALGSYGQLCLQLSTFLRASSNEHKLLLIRLLSNQIVFGLTELNWFTWTCWTFLAELLFRIGASGHFVEPSYLLSGCRGCSSWCHGLWRRTSSQKQTSPWGVNKRLKIRIQSLLHSFWRRRNSYLA